jgi:hypothetical protein
MDMYNEGYSPLDSCAAHKTEIEKRVKEEMELAGNLDAAIEEPNEAPQEDWEAYILGPDGEVLPPPPVAPLPPPPPLQRLRHAPPPPQPAPNALLPPPPPQPARVARARQPVPAPRRGVLAQPVAPLPAALALGSDPYQAGDVRVQRQRILQTLQRASREETAETLTRRIKVSMWLISVCLCHCPLIIDILNRLV